MSEDFSIGADVKLIDKPEESWVLNCLPGVGAFNDGMEVLKSKKLVEPLIDFSKSGKPLGCLFRNGDV